MTISLGGNDQLVSLLIWLAAIGLVGYLVMELFKNVMMVIMAVVFMAVLLPGGVSFLSLRTDVLPPASGAQTNVQAGNAGANAGQQGGSGGNGGGNVQGGATQGGGGSASGGAAAGGTAAPAAGSTNRLLQVAVDVSNLLAGWAVQWIFTSLDRFLPGATGTPPATPGGTGNTNQGAQSGSSGGEDNSWPYGSGPRPGGCYNFDCLNEQ